MGYNTLTVIIGNTTLTIELIGLNTEIIQKNSNLITMSLPKQDSSQAMSFDFMGAEKTIQLNGILTANDIPTLANKAQDLEKIISGDQSVGTYVSNIFGTMNVRVNKVNLKYEGGVPLKVEYDIELVECAGESP